MKRISKKEASERYGVLVGGVNSMYKYYLREDGFVVDSDGDLRYIPPFENGMYEAEVIATASNGKKFEYKTYSSMLEYAKQDAIRRLPITCLNPSCPIGKIDIVLTITKNDEYIDSDEGTATWDGKELKFDVEEM